MLSVQLVDPVLEAYLLRGWRDRLVVQGAAVEAQKLCLHGNRQLGILPV
jgi:hypothetical protein